MPAAPILIVGGGPAGLTTAGALKQIGLDSVILDWSERVGQSWEQRYDRLHLHTVRAYSGLAHFPIPRSYPQYLSKDQYAQYLREYAAHFALNVVPRTLVTRVRQAPTGWALETDSETWTARMVVIATGQFNRPVYPDWPGLATYRGVTLHSARYRSGRAFRNRRVLVIGAGNSGMEIAVDLAEQGAALAAISMRTAPPVVPRDLLGIPAQAFAIAMNPLPPSISDPIGRTLSRWALGDLGQFGLPTPVWQPFASRRTPAIDVGFAPALKAGKVSIRPGVSAFTQKGVAYIDGHEEPFDAVIFATGFRSGLEELLEPAGLVDSGGIPLSPSGAPTACAGLFFMGFFESVRGLLYESNLASQRLAREIKKESRD
ncbi:MAG TPA: NAD(P)/FAD-dependent oxidoreductase [Anaerolineaceae bacterium]|nr:NAD(P)/FAD-dependent oxidoreductase [Anaerolineaceae bacterium]